ncbi:MAG TPA: aspartyl protease family protein [Candidatus Krumholzibacteria bacterium]|nr:aspartyl protease family protein [Candidatus Krumholzibacteria bacterium]
MKNTHTLLLALTLVASASAIKAAPAPGTLASVPITVEGNHIRIPVSVNGSQPFSLVLDTGMPAPGIMLYDNDRTAALGLKFGSTDQVQGGGKGPAMTAQVASGQHIAIGDVSLSGVQVTVLPPPHGFPSTAAGVIGLELFSRFAVRIDIDNHTLDLLDKDSYQPPASASVIPLRMEHGVFPFIDARVTIGDGPAEPVNIAVDLGASHSLWLNQRKGRLTAPPGSIRTPLGRGVSGRIEGSLGRVQKFEMGDVTFEHVIALFPDADYQNPGHFDFKDGFIGAELLTRFVVTFDYASKRMVLVRGQRFDEPFETDMSGLTFASMDLARRSIDGVLPGSPAETAGITAGDILIAVNGKPTESYNPDELRKLFKQDGAEVRLTLERNGAQMEKTIKLRRLV